MLLRAVQRSPLSQIESEFINSDKRISKSESFDNPLPIL
jgi:hypothetical protein